MSVSFEDEALEQGTLTSPLMEFFSATKFIGCIPQDLVKGLFQVMRRGGLGVTTRTETAAANSQRRRDGVFSWRPWRLHDHRALGDPAA